MAITDFINKFGGWTEKYLFYDGEIELRYDPKEHVYLLVTDDGDLEVQAGVTSVCHIIDKSSALVPWAAKMMAQKLLRTIPQEPSQIDVNTSAYILGYSEIEKWVLEAKDAHKEKLEDAGAIGNMAHNWIESLIKLLIAKKYDEAFNFAQALPFNQLAASACTAALDWMVQHNVNWIETETKIYSRKYKYAGTLDGLATVSSCKDSKCQGCRDKKPWHDKLTVVDWKTSNYLYLEYLLQTAAYQQAVQEERGIKVAHRWVIRLDKENGKFDPWHLDENAFDSDFGGFVMCLDLTRRKDQLEKRIADVKSGIRAAAKEERRIAKQAKETLLAKERAEAKASKQEARVVALALDCGRVKKGYKGFRKPTCKTNQGGACVNCQTVWNCALNDPPKQTKKTRKPAKEPVAKVVKNDKKANIMASISILEAMANRKVAVGSDSTTDRIPSVLTGQTGTSSSFLNRWK